MNDIFSFLYTAVLLLFSSTINILANSQGRERKKQNLKNMKEISDFFCFTPKNREKIKKNKKIAWERKKKLSLWKNYYSRQLIEIYIFLARFCKKYIVCVIKTTKYWRMKRNRVFQHYWHSGQNCCNYVSISDKNADYIELKIKSGNVVGQLSWP